MLKTHMKIHKTQTTSKDECKCAASKDYNDSLNEIRILRKNLENAKNEIKTLIEYHQLKQGESKTQSQEKVNIPNETSRQSVITYRCTTCSFITKSTATLDYHKEFSILLPILPQNESSMTDKLPATTAPRNRGSHAK